MPSEEQLVPFLKTLVRRGPGSTWPPVSPKQSLYQLSYRGQYCSTVKSFRMIKCFGFYSICFYLALYFGSIRKWFYSFHIWAASWQNQQNDCAPSEDSDKPGHPPSLIRVLAVHMKKAWVLSYPLSTQQRLWSDWADAQADLSLCWANMSVCWFCHEAAHFHLVVWCHGCLLRSIEMWTLFVSVNSSSWAYSLLL